MCQAPVLRFSCGHGILMDFQPCRTGPCPSIKTTSAKLATQPYRCYNCQRKRATSGASATSSISARSSALSIGSADSGYGSISSPSAPLPGVVNQPAGSVRYGTGLMRTHSSSISRPFSFSCSSSDHYATPHYSNLPGHLNHQDHPCPPCQIEQMRQDSDREVTALAKSEFPCLRGEMLVRNGRIREDWQSNLTLEKYIDERRTEDKQMWFFVTKKWTQDLKKARVLVAEEDGLGLMPG